MMKNAAESSSPAVAAEAEAADASLYVGEYLRILETVPPDLVRGVSVVRNFNAEISGELRDSSKSS